MPIEETNEYTYTQKLDAIYKKAMETGDLANALEAATMLFNVKKPEPKE